MKELISVFKLIAAPHIAWSRIFSKRTPSQTIERQMFYPLIGILALSSFVQMFYNDSELTSVIMDAIVEFATFFIGYLACVFLVSMLLPFLQQEGKAASEGKIRTFLIYNLSILVLTAIVQNLLPTRMVLWDIFPVYLLFVISKSQNFFSLKDEKKFYFTIGTFCVIILMPALIYLILSKLMPAI